ncbi:PA14 domain-containing protein [Streptomyces sp. NPDC058045]|uniref:PA14 domain-containing protein n=1 Tax=Streptomyces sp. NPDC058045 TaxID=3346311 RepID=UPI0036E12C02
MARTKKLGWVAASGAAALTCTLMGILAPDTANASSADATRLPRPAAPAGTPNTAVWPGGRFTSGGGGGSGTAPATAGPADGRTLTGVRPKLSAARQKGAVAYEFVLSTGASPRSGQLTSSGWVGGPSWQVPAGLLKNGGHYTWTVRTKDRSGRVSRDAAARSFTVAQPLGAQEDGSPTATDTLGPVTVGLATGDVSASVNTAQVPTGAGMLGATFRYDSQAAGTTAGLTGSYYAGDSATGIGAQEKPAARRTDARVDFDWGRAAPYPKAGAGAAFRAAWTGRFTVPADGVYRFGGSHDGGLRVLVDGRPVLDDWKGAKAGDRPAYGSGVRLRAGGTHRITVQYRHPGGADGGRIALWAADARHSAPVPASWLQPSGAVLPPGWTVTPDPTGAAAESAANSPAAQASSAVQQDASAAAPAGGDTSAAAGTTAPGTTVKAGQGRAGADTGKTAKSGAGAAGSATPEGQQAGIAAAEDTGAGFVYAGDKACADDAAPAGYVCAVRVPGAGTTQLYYRGGKLVRFVNPGGETTDFGFAADHRLTTVRPPLVMDWIAAGEGRDTEAARYAIGYRGDSAAAARVTGPDPAGTDAASSLRPRHDFVPAEGGTQVRVAGATGTRTVTFDGAGRTATDTDGTGRTTRYTWTEDGRLRTSADPAGRLTTTVYNEAGMPAGTYGPGPAACFGSDLRPVHPAPEGCERVPAQTTEYGAAGLTTVRADSDGVPALTTRLQLSELGLPAASVTDPGGLALTTAYGYDEAGRPTSETSPGGARKTFAYYGAEESADNPCTREKDPAPQLGLPKSVALPAGADGSARVEKFVYSRRGYPVAVNFGGSDWTCTRYDDRGTVTEMSMPGNANLPGWTVKYDSAYHGDPLTVRATHPDHTLTRTVDLLGRPVRFTDALGVTTTTGYDQAGRAVREHVAPPTGSGAAQVRHTRYDAADRVQRTDLDGRTLATAGYDTAGTLKDVRYGNGTRLDIRRDPAGRITARDWTLADGSKQSTRVTRSRSGTVVDESTAGKDPRPDGPNYRYDAAGRLVRAHLTGHDYTRDFTGKQAGCPGGTRPEAGADGNVVRLTDRTPEGTAVTGYCYDTADRLLATTGDHPVTGTTYGLNGHLTGYRVDGRQETQHPDAVERYLGASVSGPGAADVRYTKDVVDHLTGRTAKTVHGTEELRYGHTDMNDPAPDLVLDGGKRPLARVLGLPGGVVLTLDAHRSGAAATTWSHPTVRGDIFLVTGDDGRRRGDQYQYGLYGEPLRADGTVDPQHLPDNLPGAYDYGWLGRYQVGTEHQGALLSTVLDTRVLNPTLGRFSAPVSSGPFLNPYEYAAGDPVNHTSINGYSLEAETE